MAISISPQSKISQKQTIGFEMQKSLEILQLSKTELIQRINDEVEANPTLEIIEESITDDPINDIPELKSELVSSESTAAADPDENEVGQFEFENSSPPKKPIESSYLYQPREKLSDHLLKQLRLTSATQQEILIGIVIANSLDEDGFLNESPEEIAEISGSNLEVVQKVLSLMQSLDPPGTCARSVKECLLIQVRENRFLRDHPLAGLLVSIIFNHFDDFKRKNYKIITKSLKASIDDVTSAGKIISGLDPAPGRKFVGYDPGYINPDLFLSEFEGKFEIRFNDDGMPKIKLSSLYRNNGNGHNHLSEEDRDFISHKRRSAELLAQSIYQRQRTLYRVMESILKFQREFFENGCKELKPLKIKTVAEDLDLSKSTVARATMNKYVYTPMGTLSLRYFFNGAIEQSQSDAVSSQHVHYLIKKIISEENPQKPYSDAKIEERLKAAGFDVQRRTVAKFREKLGILPASLRKKI
jgi:RNA polymerase sigma-54 factor